MRKCNSYIRFGLLFNAIFLIANHYSFIPEFIKGILAGLGITLMLIGALKESNKLSNLKNHKKVILSKMFRK